MSGLQCPCKFADAARCALEQEASECVCACHRTIAFKIDHGGISFEVSQALARAIDREGRHPSQRLNVVRACERDRVLCVSGVTDCRCCSLHGTKSPGGGAIYYPEDGKGHVPLMSIDAFSDLAFQEGAIV